jgi:hypothetical protein
MVTVSWHPARLSSWTVALSWSKCYYCKQIRETFPAVQDEGSSVAAPMLKSIAWWRRRDDTGGWGPSDATMTGRLLLVFMIAILSAAGTAWCKISPSAWVSPVLFVLGSSAHSVLLHFTARVSFPTHLLYIICRICNKNICSMSTDSWRSCAQWRNSYNSFAHLGIILILVLVFYSGLSDRVRTVYLFSLYVVSLLSSRFTASALV